LPLAAVTVLVPWTLRCREVYGRWIVGGATLGQNLFWGVNARYINFDYTEPARDRINKYGRRLWLIRLPSRFRWDQAADANLIDRSRGDVKRAMSFVIDHPGFYWRSRVKRLADWVTPLSFFDRHYRMNLYRGALNRPWIRRILVSLSVGATMMVLAGAVPGLLWTLAPPSRRVVIGAVILTFVSTVMVVSMSRYRVPVEPLMLVLTAGFVTDLSRRPPWRSARFTAVLTGWIVLALLWALNAEEVWVELSPLY
jgi:hypothetical protein